MSEQSEEQAHGAEETAAEVEDQDAGPASQPGGAAGEVVDEDEDQDAGPASVPEQ